MHPSRSSTGSTTNTIGRGESSPAALGGGGPSSFSSSAQPSPTTTAVSYVPSWSSSDESHHTTTTSTNTTKLIPATSCRANSSSSRSPGRDTAGDGAGGRGPVIGSPPKRSQSAHVHGRYVGMYVCMYVCMYVHYLYVPIIFLLRNF